MYSDKPAASLPDCLTGCVVFVYVFPTGPAAVELKPTKGTNKVCDLSVKVNLFNSNPVGLATCLVGDPDAGRRGVR